MGETERDFGRSSEDVCEEHAAMSGSLEMRWVVAASSRWMLDLDSGSERWGEFFSDGDAKIFRRDLYVHFTMGLRSAA